MALSPRYICIYIDILVDDFVVDDLVDDSLLVNELLIDGLMGEWDNLYRVRALSHGNDLEYWLPPHGHGVSTSHANQKIT